MGKLSVEGRRLDQYFDNYKRQLSLLLDKNRTLKYKYAIYKAVKPGDIVIDFGCGTGILGFFALQAGAKHVYAIEETSIIDYAQQLAVENAYDKKITFLKKPGKEIIDRDLPEKGDVILSEPISNLLLEGNAWSTIEYLKKYLKEDGLILPAAGTLYVVPVNSPPQTFLDSDYFIGGENVYNVKFLNLPKAVLYKSEMGEDIWIAKPQPLLDFNLKKDTLSDLFQSSVKFSINQEGQFFGVEFFVKIKIFGNITLSSREQQNYASWSPVFAPSSYQPLICPGDTLRVTVSNEILSPYRCKWTLKFTHNSKLLLSDNKWWHSESAVPKLASGVMISKVGLLNLRKDDYSQYDCDNELELDIIELIPKDMSCSEICQTIFQSQKYSLAYEEIFDRLIKLLHKLLTNSLIELPIPYERFRVTDFQSIINIP